MVLLNVILLRLHVCLCVLVYVCSCMCVCFEVRIYFLEKARNVNHITHGAIGLPSIFAQMR